MNIRFLRNTGVAGKPYKKGDVADLSDAIAKDFIRRGRAEAVLFATGVFIEPAVAVQTEPPTIDDVPPAADRLAEVALAIIGLDADNAEHFTKDGDVRCDVLSDICGFEVSADMRDAAVASLEAQQPKAEAVKNDGDDNTVDNAGV